MASKRLGRREFLRMGALSVAGAALAACAPKATEEPAAPAEVPEEEPEAEPTEAPPSAEVKDIRLSVWADVQDAAVYENMLNAWHEVQDEYRVDAEQYAGGYYEKIQANFAGGDPADVLYYQGWVFQPYAENKVLSPLDQYVEADQLGDLWPDNQNYRNNTEWHGETFMTPTDVGSLVIYYNKDQLDRQGVPHPKAGWTWEDYQDAIEKLSYEEDGTKYYSWAQGAGWNGAYARVVNFMRRNGYLEWDEVVEPKKALWDHEDIISALQFCIYDTIDNGWCPGPEVISGGGVGVDSGRCAMVLEGPWFMPRCWGELSTLAAETGGINYDVVEPPVGEDGKNHNFGHVHGHCITTEAKEPDGSWELIKFILSDPGQEIIANGGRMCGHPDNIDSIWGPIASENYNFENTEAFSNGMREGSTPVILGEGGTFQVYGGGPLATLWDALLGLQQTAAEAVPAANIELQAALDEYWAER